MAPIISVYTPQSGFQRIDNTYNPPVSVVPYPNPRVVVTGTQSFDDILSARSASDGRFNLARILQEEHPIYQKYKGMWADWHNWYTGEEIEQYLYQHIRERTEAYRRRKKRAYYFNYTKAIINLIGSFLFSRAITRSFFTEAQGIVDQSPMDLEDTNFMKNVDKKNTSMNDFMRQVFNQSKVFGYVDVMVDMPKTHEEIVSEQQRLDYNLRPYLYVILPTSMLNWEIDADGNYLWVRWVEEVTVQEHAFTSRQGPRRFYTTWTRTDWTVFEVIERPGEDADVRLVDSGVHGLGVVPCVRFYGEKDLVEEKRGLSMVSMMGKINVAIMNYVSWLDEEIANKSLNILVMRDPNETGDGMEEGGANAGASRGVEIGSNNVLFYTGDTPPFYLAPASAPGQFILDVIAKSIAEIYRVATLGNDTGVDQTKSGVAYCLARGTLIDMPRDVSVYPDGIPIEMLVGHKLFYVYGRVGNVPALCLAEKAWQSGTHVPVYEVKFEWYAYGNWYYGSLKATAEHKLMLRNGQYRRVKDLQVGDSLMPFTRGTRGKYVCLSAPGGIDREYEHRFIARHLFQDFDGKRATIVHHKNGRRLDNRVKNLEVMSQSEHASHHMEDEAFKARVSAGGEKRRKEDNGRWLTFSREVLLHALDAHNWQPTYAAQSLGISFITLKRKMAMHNISIPNNHKVTSIEFSGYEDVFDISVPESHNFVANGIVVHNSYEFNETNRMLADNADLLQRGEEKILALYKLWLDEPWEGYVDYPDSFDIGSYDDELRAITDAKTAVRSPTFGRELEKRLARKLLERSSASVADKIMAEIDTLPEKEAVWAGQRTAIALPRIAGQAPQQAPPATQAPSGTPKGAQPPKQ